jgi:molecular chaperone GrpE
MNENDQSQPVTDAPVEPAVEVVSLEDRIVQLEQEKNDMRERMLRVAAEFENWKKRSRKDQEDAQFRVKEQILKDVIEVADNLERAISSLTDASDSKAVKDGVGLVLRMFSQKLERYDVKAFESKGKSFDPRLHEAVARVPSTDVPVGGIVEELVKGYNLGDRLLRPASVVVAVAPPSAQPAGETEAS